MARVKLLLEQRQVRSRAVQLNENWWSRDCGDLIAFLDSPESTPIALLRGTMGYKALDPETGTRTPVDRALHATLRPDALAVYRPMPARVRGLPSFLRFTVGRCGADILLALGVGLLAAILGMLIPIGTGLIVDHAIPDADRQLLFEVCLGVGAAVLGSFLFAIAHGIYLLRVEVGMQREGQPAVWQRTLSLPMRFFAGHASADLCDRLMAVDTIGSKLSGGTLLTLVSAILASVNLVLLWVYSPSLTGVAIAIGLVVVVATWLFARLFRPNVEKLLEAHGLHTSLTVQMIRGVSKLRVARAQPRAVEAWIRSYTKQVQFTRRVEQLYHGAVLLNQALPTVGTLALFWVARDSLMEGRSTVGSRGLSLGGFMAFLAAFWVYLRSLSTILSKTSDAVEIGAHGRRLKPVLEEEPEFQEVRAPVGQLLGGIELRDVSYRYGPGQAEVLSGVQITAEPGEFIAVVGPSGSGKSTLVRLLLGFDQPTEGVVRFDGRDLADLDAPSVRQQLGAVLQSGQLEPRSIFDNVACGRDLDAETVWLALARAGMESDVRAMPMGLHTRVSVAGSNLSGGQRQRVLIARALVGQPPIMLLDEATSALDNRTQGVVTESIAGLDVTRVVIAHRLSTIRDADRIYVLNQGRVVQVGTYDELMNQSGELFEEMMERQLA